MAMPARHDIARGRPGCLYGYHEAHFTQRPNNAMKDFSTRYERAASRTRGKQALDKLIPNPRSAATLARVATVFSMLAVTNVTADTEIHRCLLEDGTFAFQEMPCSDTDASTAVGSEAGESRTPARDDDAFDFVNPFDEPAGPATPPEATPPESVSRDRADCEKKTRDAIDAIDLEMRKNAYTNEQGQEYLAELLTLTRQLRACKQL